MMGRRVGVVKLQSCCHLEIFFFFWRNACRIISLFSSSKETNWFVEAARCHLESYYHFNNLPQKYFPNATPHFIVMGKVAIFNQEHGVLQSPVLGRKQISSLDYICLTIQMQPTYNWLASLKYQICIFIFFYFLLAATENWFSAISAHLWWKQAHFSEDCNVIEWFRSGDGLRVEM